jgi:hypothetical protein
MNETATGISATLAEVVAAERRQKLRRQAVAALPGVRRTVRQYHHSTAACFSALEAPAQLQQWQLLAPLALAAAALCVRLPHTIVVEEETQICLLYTDSAGFVQQRSGLVVEQLQQAMHELSLSSAQPVAVMKSGDDNAAVVVTAEELSDSLRSFVQSAADQQQAMQRYVTPKVSSPIYKQLWLHNKLQLTTCCTELRAMQGQHAFIVRQQLRRAKPPRAWTITSKFTVAPALHMEDSEVRRRLRCDIAATAHCYITTASKPVSCR